MNSNKKSTNNKDKPTKKHSVNKHCHERKRGNWNDKSEMMIERATMKDSLNSELSAKLETTKKSPTILIELSKREWNRLQHNAIHLSNVSIIKPDKKSVLHKKIHYDTIEYGKNIKLQQNNFKPRTFKMKDTNSSLSSTVLNYPTIKNKMMIITTDLDSTNKVNANNVLITSNNTPTFLDDNFQSSGKVLLFMIRNTNTKDPECNDDWMWRDSLLKKLKKCKNSICIQGGKYNHFNSQGYIAAFGNKALFAQSHVKSTVSQYANKKGKDDTHASKIADDANIFESLIAQEVETAVDRFSKYFPNIRSLIAPILKIAFEKQKDTGDINFKEVMTSNHGLWQSELCCDAITRDFHTERDITYTLISIPYQFTDNVEKKQCKPTYFMLQLNEKNTIAFRMTPKSSFFFSGTMITHKQFCEDGYEDVDDRKKISHFYNIACYGNERLFHHLRLSFRRSLSLEKN